MKQFKRRKDKVDSGISMVCVLPLCYPGRCGNKQGLFRRGHVLIGCSGCSKFRIPASTTASNGMIFTSFCSQQQPSLNTSRLPNILRTVPQSQSIKGLSRISPPQKHSETHLAVSNDHQSLEHLVIWCCVWSWWV
jgi:hypothetical protein